MVPASDPAQALSGSEVETLADAAPEALSDAQAIWTVKVQGRVSFDHVAVDRQGRYAGVLHQAGEDGTGRLMLSRIDLWTGHSMAPVEVPAVESDAARPEDAYLMQRKSSEATDDGFTVLQAAIDSDAEAEQTSVTWSAQMIARDGSEFTSETGSFEVTDDYAVSLAEPGRLVASTTSQFDAVEGTPDTGGSRGRIDVVVVDPVTGRTVEMQGDTGLTRASCADDDCTLKSVGEWSSGGESARSYVEQRMITTGVENAHLCIPWPQAAGFNIAEICASGVTGAGLDTSGDLAPDSAVSRVAALAAVDSTAMLPWSVGPLSLKKRRPARCRGS
ncbi:hypothetical protein JT358_03535 [Micrococcales bacterium 31B]|nr:hypothetical protein [Micrococcales bacterium 31B]